MKRLLIAVIIIIATAVPIVWFFPALQSYVAMSVYSGAQNKLSVMQQNGFAIKMKTAKGWYPNVLVFNADGFSDWAGIRAEMSILYNFGDFDAATRTSSLYDIKSDLYSAFYGAYAIKMPEGKFGFAYDSKINISEVVIAVDYDYSQLVLRNFGCQNPAFEVKEHSVKNDIAYAGSGGWVQIDAQILANGVAHNFKEDKLAYLQYGRPLNVECDFAKTTMAGRVYAKYFDEYGCTIMLYIIAKDIPTINECDQNVLSNTVIAGTN